MKITIPVYVLYALISCAEKGDIPATKLIVPQETQDSSLVPVRRSLMYEQYEGKYIYDKFCAVCHGTEGKGDGFNAYNLDPKPRDLTDTRYMNALSDSRLLETISQGGKGVNKSPFMPAWSGRLTPRERAYVAAYVRQMSNRSQ